jgi:hypothetical protein
MTKYVVRQGKRIAVETAVFPTKTKQRRKDGSRHLGCPLGWATRVNKVVKSQDQLMVAIWLHRRRAISRRDLFSVPNRELESELEVDRNVKYRTLRHLEKAGAIDIVRDGKHAVRVRILW